MKEIFQSNVEGDKDKEPTVKDILEKALAAGYIEEEDIEFLDDGDEDLERLVIYFYTLINEETDDDPDEVLQRWGLVDYMSQ